MSNPKQVEKEIVTMECMTDTTSSCSSSPSRDTKSTTISIRVHVWLLEKLKEKGVRNLSGFITKLLMKDIEEDLTAEEKLEAELEMLEYEMKKLQKYHKTLLAHGSYAKCYMSKLKDGTTVSHSPFRYSKEQQPFVSREELEIVNETVEMRNELDKKYEEKLNELLKLKKKRLGLGIMKVRK